MSTLTSIFGLSLPLGAILRLFRPMPDEALLAAIPASATRVAVLDRTKEPGSGGEPLFLDVTAVLAEAASTGERERLPRVIGGRYGLSSKDFTPAMAVAVFDELAKPKPRPRFIVGINDDVTRLSLDFDPTIDLEDPLTQRAVFYGLGSDEHFSISPSSLIICGTESDILAPYFCS